MNHLYFKFNFYNKIHMKKNHFSLLQSIPFSPLIFIAFGVSNSSNDLKSITVE